MVKSGRTAAAKKAEEESLPLNQLAVVVVDLAGNVVRTIPLNETNSTQNEDGSWSISVPGFPQLDCIVIANLDGPITVFDIGDNVFDDSNLLFTPTTEEDLEVSLASTAAYQNLLDELGGEGTFESLGLDVTDPAQLAVLNNLIETVQEVLEGQAFVGATSIADALAQVQGQVQTIVQVEAENITTPTPDSTLAAAAQAGSVYWFESFEPSDILYGVLSQENPEAEFEFDGNQFVQITEDDTGDLMLNNGEWVVTADTFLIGELNEDGSVTLTDATGPEQINVKSTQNIGLAGRTISTFVNAYGDLRGMVDALNPTATFATGSIAYRVDLTVVNDLISLWYEPGNETGVCPWDSQKNANDYGGNCDTLSGWTWVEGQAFPTYGMAYQSVAAIKSADVAGTATGSVMVGINWPGGNETITVQLVNNTEKTANYYSYDYSANIADLVGTGTWSDLTLPGIEGAEAAAISIEIPETVLAAGDFFEDERRMIFALNDGFVRIGQQYKSGDTYESGVLIFNNIAADSVIDAFDYKAPQVGSWLTDGDFPAVLTFVNNLHYTVTSTDPDCFNGLELGVYSLKNNSLSADVELEVDGSCGLSDLDEANTLTVAANTMTLFDGSEEYSFTRLESGALLGSWIGYEPEAFGDHQLILSILPDNRFVFSQYGTSDPENGNDGYEYGTYTLDSGTGAFVPTVEINKDGSWGFSDNEATLTLTTSGDEMTITVTDPGQNPVSFTLTRVTGAAAL